MQSHSVFSMKNLCTEDFSAIDHVINPWYPLKATVLARLVFIADDTACLIAFGSIKQVIKVSGMDILWEA